MEEWGTEEYAPKGPKRLFKSRTDKKWLGVCGGLAKYLDCDPSIVRIITILSTLCWGTGLVVYLAAALVMPFEDEVKS